MAAALAGPTKYHLARVQRSFLASECQTGAALVASLHSRPLSAPQIQPLMAEEIAKGAQ